MSKFIDSYAKIHITQSLRMHREPDSNISQLLIPGGIGAGVTKLPQDDVR